MHEGISFLRTDTARAIHRLPLPDVNLISSFLHTYRYFTSDLGLLCRLITRYRYTLAGSLAVSMTWMPGSHMNCRYFVRVPTDAPAAVTKWLSKWKGPIRMR